MTLMACVLPPRPCVPAAAPPLRASCLVLPPTLLKVLQLAELLGVEGAESMRMAAQQLRLLCINVLGWDPQDSEEPDIV
jgi:hypothetical protein